MSILISPEAPFNNIYNGSVSSGTGQGTGPAIPTNAWTPASLTNLLLWLDDTSLVDSGAGKVSQWTDLSGNGRNYTQGTNANRFTLLSNGINGKSVAANVSGGDKYLSGPASSFINVGNAFYAFIVGKYISTGVAFPGMFLFKNSARNGGFYTPGDGNFLFTTGTFQPVVKLSTFSSGTVFSALVTYNGNGESNANFGRWFNQVETTDGGAAVNAPTNVNSVGNANASTSWDGYIGCVIMGQATLTAAEITNLFAWSTNKFGV